MEVAGQHTATKKMKNCALLPDEVQVWLLRLPETYQPDVERHLSDDDQRRASRFAFEIDRRRFIHARYVMRQHLGAYLDVPPREVPLLFNQHGKPMLESSHAIAFNLSHSGDYCLFAMGAVTQIGVDIEAFGQRAGLRELATSVCTQAELRSLDEVGDPHYEKAFLEIWTKKEALLKAIGVGLTVDPSTVHVGLTDDLRRAAIPAAAPEGPIKMITLPDHECYVAALAVTDQRLHIRFFADCIAPLPGRRYVQSQQLEYPGWAKNGASIGMTGNAQRPVRTSII
jgi:4'-phosphopantetheinyl transferase